MNGKVDVLINNAGVGVSKSISELSIDDFLSVFNVNVFGLALFTKEISKYMIDESYGTIINIGSTASLKGYKNGSIYSSSKFAVRCLTQCWQAELSHTILEFAKLTQVKLQPLLEILIELREMKYITS